MEVEYDIKSDSKYIRLMKGKVSSTNKIKDWLFHDIDKNGEVIGIEVLNASKHLISINTIKGKLFSRGEVIQMDDDKGADLKIVSPPILDQNRLWMTQP